MILIYLPLIEKVIVSFSFHLERRRGCKFVSNLKSLFSFVKTKAGGFEAAIGETILHIPEI